MKAYGNDKIKTPNFNGLAAKSCVFDRPYVTQPVCSPSRASLLTGLYPHTHGITTNNIALDSQVPVLVEMLRPREVVSAWYGKWHLGDEIFKQRGFDFFESTEDAYYAKHWSKERDPKARSGYHDFLVKAGIQPDTPEGHSRELANRVPKELSKPAFLARKGIEFLEAQRSRPFVLYLSFLDPHTPFNSVNDHLYPLAEMEVPATFHEKLDPTVLAKTISGRALFDAGTYPNYEHIIDTAEDLKSVKARYWGKVTLVDEMVGRVLDHLSKLGLTEDTIVVFTSEHGDMMGDHRLLFKGLMYEESATVPLLLKLPAQKQSLKISKPVSHIDLVPTLLDLMNQPLPAWLQGNSWSPYLLQGSQPPDRDVIVEWNEAGPETDRSADLLRMIATPDGWKMTVNYSSQGELYNLTEDPKERTNLFYQDRSLDMIERLVRRINRWQRSTGDSLLTFDTSRWRQHRNQISAAAG
jgi:arylsulfatase A-like enzyme